jgi:hypothetical protein
MFDYSYWRLSGKYNPNIKAEMESTKIIYLWTFAYLKVMFDKKHNLLHMGSLGKSGFHQVRTMLRFVIEGDKIGYGNY